MPYEIPALTPEQRAEFPDKLLSDFAMAWITFQRSSPCTLDKRSFAYFQAPKESDMAEEDILYGPDRALAYRRLMHAFRACQRARAFDRYFDPRHNEYYQADTVNGLVILREWADEQVTLPGLYTGSFSSIKPDAYDEIWLIVRSLKSMPKNPLGNIYHVPELSPSVSLWHHYLDLKKAGKWDANAFAQDYAPKFLSEMLQPVPNAKLQELYALLKSKAILCACFCRDESLCHRLLVRKIMDAMKNNSRP